MDRNLEFLNGKEILYLRDSAIKLANLLNTKKINNLIFLCYSQELEKFLFWCQQLIAESLGKKGKGIIPLISIGPRDHHSLLQLYLDGPKDNFFYIFSFKGKSKKKKTKRFFIEALNGANMYSLHESQKKAMISLLKNKNIPFLSIEIKKRNEETLGELFSYFILETVFIGENLRINPFNQPAVEQIKILTKKYLFKKNQK